MLKYIELAFSTRDLSPTDATCILGVELRVLDWRFGKKRILPGLIGTCKPATNRKQNELSEIGMCDGAQTTLDADVFELFVTKGCKFYQNRVRLSGHI